MRREKRREGGREHRRNSIANGNGDSTGLCGGTHDAPNNGDPTQSTTRAVDLARIYWSSKGSCEVGRGTLPCFLGLFRHEPGRSAQMRPEGGRGAFRGKIPATAAPPVEPTRQTTSRTAFWTVARAQTRTPKPRAHSTERAVGDRAGGWAGGCADGNGRWCGDGVGASHRARCRVIPRDWSAVRRRFAGFVHKMCTTFRFRRRFGGRGPGRHRYCREKCPGRAKYRPLAGAGASDRFSWAWADRGLSRRPLKRSGSGDILRTAALALIISLKKVPLQL